MKRNTILATIGALSMLAVPAMAQDNGYDDRGHDKDDVPIDQPDPDFRRPKMKGPIPGHGPGSVEYDKTTRRDRGFDRGFDDDGWRRSRYSRRARSRQRVLGRWNHRFLDRAAVRAELRLHARRIAKLNRMERIALRSGRRGLLFRIKAAIRRENMRHHRKMSRLEGDFGFRGRGRF